LVIQEINSIISPSFTRLFSIYKPKGRKYLPKQTLKEETTMKTVEAIQPKTMKKFVIREVETLRTTRAAAYVCWICSSCW
jgi:hypothetical protein